MLLWTYIIICIPLSFCLLCWLKCFTSNKNESVTVGNCIIFASISPFGWFIVPLIVFFMAIEIISEFEWINKPVFSCRKKDEQDD